MGYFQGAATAARPLWSGDASTLRVGQLGAIWALASHFTVSDEAVQAVLPTGVGKTAVMCLLPFIVPTTRVLVVTPSQLVRDQVAEHFASLLTLRSMGALVGDILGPRIAKVEHRIPTEEAWRSLEVSDVVIGTPGVLSDAYAGVAPIPAGLFDLVLIDEAHHAPAPTWRAILQRTRGVRTALFTATPFRRDRAGIPADIVYSYPLAQAIRDGVYQPVDFIPVEIDRGADADVALATAAVERLRDPRHVSAGSALIVRTDTIEEAKRLVEVYRAAGIEIGVVHSKQTPRAVRDTLARVKAGELRGLASVAVLGEGVDLPTLKIAVYHHPHRSLPATLQFVGRVTRILPSGERPPAELLAIREAVEGETRELYAADVAWGELVPALTEAAVENERVRRRYIRTLPEPATGAFSMFALSPKLQTEVFEVPAGATVTLAEDRVKGALAGRAVMHAAVDDERQLLVIVTRHPARPEWLQSPALDTVDHELHLVVHDAARRLLFVSTSSREARDRLLTWIGAPAAPRVPPSAMNRLLHSVPIAAYSSIGLRSARARGGIQASYRTLAGSAVQRAMLPGETRAYGVGHLIGRYRTPSGGWGTRGVSVAKAKVWSQECTDLLGFKTWCFDLGTVIRSSARVGSTPPLLDIGFPRKLERFPATPIVALLDPALLQGDTMVRLPGQWCDVLTFAIEPTRLDDRRCRLSFKRDGIVRWNCDMHADGRVMPVGADLIVNFAGKDANFCELLTEHCPTLYFADGSSVIDCTLYVPPEHIPAAPAEILDTWLWEGVDVRAEAREPLPGLVNVQSRARRWLEENYPENILITDDAAGELADFVAIELGEGGVVVHLVHCKYSSEDEPGHRLKDVQEVLCQAMRSARWTSGPAFWTELDRRLSNRQATTIVGGNAATSRERIRAWVENSPATTFRIVAVQPGLRIAGATRHPAINTLLVSCLDWSRSQGAELLIVGA